MKLAISVLMWAAAVLPAADLPVRQVVLYKHGVGYFQRSGQLAAGESARLDFNASEMDDVLKSLTVEEKGGGKVSGLRYDSSEPLEHKLAAFPFRLGDAQPLSAVLDQLKGARVELHFASGAVAGAIVSGRLVPGGEKQPEREVLTLLLDDGDLRVFDLAAASSIRFTDPRLQAQFKDYLAALTDARSREKRSVYIDSTSGAGRALVVGYMVPTPVWKSSYRLIFGETGPLLEGWAIVDNTTGEDWNNVLLSLVSGRPVSFISRLYEPRYVQRPTADLAENRAAAPVVYQGAVDQAAVAGLVSPSAEALGRARKVAAPAPPMFRSDAAASSIAVSASGSEAGELFEYRIGTPVTVRKNESAMLPFFQDKLDARKLLIYSDPGSTNPMNAAEITNSTGQTLDGGPITVYDGGVYGGEALMETLKAGDKRLISYAVDLGTRVTTRFDSQADTVREAHLRRGVLTTRSAAVETRTYTIRNVDQKAKTLIIEHAARPGYTLLNVKPLEKTSDAWRFEVKLAPGSTEKFPVTEERVYETSVLLTNLTPDVLATYVQNKALGDAARKQLEQIADRKRQIAASAERIGQREEQIKELGQDQDRIRRNLDALGRVSGQQDQVQAYARQLAAQETQIAGLRDQVAAERKQKAQLDSDLSRMIETLTF